MREVISLHVGGAGIQAGSSCWELFCLEHGILPDGTPAESNEGSDTFAPYFNETSGGKYVPRAIFVDLEPTFIDNIRTDKYSQLFDSDHLIAGKEDSGKNFAQGFHGRSEEQELCLDRIRQVAEKCEDLQGFQVMNSVGGGTGSGFGSHLYERLSADYNKKEKLGFIVYPSAKTQTAVTEPYNAVLATKSLR